MEDQKNQTKNNGDIGRRDFAAISVAAGLAATAGSAAAASHKVVETEVEIKMPDGTCDAAFIHPKSGSHPGVLIWPDAFGLRPSMRDIAKRLAAEGYSVLVPNPFYRSAKAPVIGDNFDFSNPEQRNRLMGYRGAMSNDGIDSDAKAYLAFLDAQPQTSKRHKAGVQGYCMGGALSFRTAAAVSNRIGAVGSFHGGNGLVTDKPDSPHLLIAKTNAAYLICQAHNDDAQNPKMKDDLKAAFTAAGKAATVDVYQANHGWTVKGGAVYNEGEAERAWTNLTALYKANLA